MAKKHFALKLIPPRPDFAQTMTDEEREIMQQHVAYWKPYVDNGTMMVMGPVMDPRGVYGLGIVEVDSEEQLLQLMDADPASHINQYEHHPMMALRAEKVD